LDLLLPRPSNLSAQVLLLLPQAPPPLGPLYDLSSTALLWATQVHPENISYTSEPGCSTPLSGLLSSPVAPLRHTNTQAHIHTHRDTHTQTHSTHTWVLTCAHTQPFWVSPALSTASHCEAAISLQTVCPLTVLSARVTPSTSFQIVCLVSWWFLSNYSRAPGYMACAP
jgi:hypothetical protein